MGIKHLNKYLRENCTKRSIRKLSLQHLRGKKIVIDTSIYLYRFKEEHALFENMFLLMSVLKLYEIIPLFVFDGKPPIEKKQVLLERVARKKVAQDKMTVLKENLNNNEIVMSLKERTQTVREMEECDRLSTRITTADIEQVQLLMNLYDVSFVVAPEEADQLCAYLVNKDIAWACMSDDMDMFLYGCKRVLRHTSVLHHDVLLYDTTDIQAELNLTKTSMTELIMLMGTDYSIMTRIQSFDQVIEWYRLYQKTPMQVHMYDWFGDMGFINERDRQTLLDTLALVNHQYDSVKLWWKHQKKIMYPDDSHSAEENAELMKKFLSEKDGFIFAY